MKELTADGEHRIKTDEDKEAERDPILGYYHSWTGQILLWVSMIGGPVLWALQLQTNYTLVRVACANHSRLVLELVSVAFLAAGLGVAWLSWWNWERIGRHWPSTRDHGMVGHARFMSVVGLLSAALFSWIIFAQSMANIILDPCEF